MHTRTGAPTTPVRVRARAAGVLDLHDDPLVIAHATSRRSTFDGVYGIVW